MQKKLFILTLSLLASVLTSQAGDKQSQSVTPSSSITFGGGLNLPGLNAIFRSGIYGHAEVLFSFPTPSVSPKGGIGGSVPAANVPFQVYTIFRNRPVLVGQFTTDNFGNYTVGLPPGTYYIIPPEELFSEPFGPITVGSKQKVEQDMLLFFGFPI